MSKAENIVTGFFGHKGHYKTSMGVLFTWLENLLGNRKYLYSNIELKMPNFNYLEGNDLVSLDKKLDDSIVFIDELHDYAPAERYSSEQNFNVAHFFLQSRHTKSNIYYTTQYKDQIDRRIQRITDIDIICQNLYYDADDDGNDDLALITVIDKRGTGNLPLQKTLYMTPVWDMYDSTERVNPFKFKGEEWQKQN